MRKKSYGTLKVRVISGTYVVFIAFDMKVADAAGPIGSGYSRSAPVDLDSVLENKRGLALGRLEGGDF
jgi:hypothetical protein